MSSSPLPSPTPREAALHKETERLREDNKALRIEVKLLREKIDLMSRKMFGSKSEQMDAEQLLMKFLEDAGPKKEEASGSAVTALEAELAKKEKKLKKPRKEREPGVPENLEVSERVIVDPDEVKADPDAWRIMGEEVTEQIDYQPAKFTKRLIVRRKYVRRDHPYKAPVIADLDTLADRSIAAPGLLAQIIVAKFCDHLPLYRQEQIYRMRHGIDLPRQTTCKWLGMCAEWLQPIYERIHTGVLDGGYLEVDETVVKYLTPGEGKASQGYLWTLKRPGGDCVFVWRTGRGVQCLDSILPANLTVVIGCDGYASYQSYAKRSDGRITLSGCWAHVRRKFDEAKKAYPMAALNVLLMIKELYLIERRLRDARASANTRQREREVYAKPIVERIGKLLRIWQEKDRFLPKSLMGQAISYTLSLWPQLQVYLSDGRVEIDNNLVENAIRPTAVGKKNWLFVGEAQTGDRSAILFTIIEACRARGINPWEYLKDVLTRLPSMNIDDIDTLLPGAWAKEKGLTVTVLACERPKGPSQAVA